MAFVVNTFSINGPLLIEPQRLADDRGFFEETFRLDHLQELGIPQFVQENHSFSKKPLTIRGMHYQLNPKAQGKLVLCISGAILDVIVDIRRNSPTYGKHEKILLCGSFPKMLYVPPGFAHGFLTYGPDSVHLIYKTTEYYDKGLDRAIRWDDPELGIDWSVDWKGNCVAPTLSDKDRNAPLLKDADNNF